VIQLHPAIAHFPIALLCSTAIFGVLSLFVKKELFKEIVFWNLLLGLCTAIAAAITGLFEERQLVHNQEIHEILIKHKINGFAILIVFLILLTWFWLKKINMGKKEYLVWVLWLVIGAGMIIYQGFLGGRMVFEQGAGVKPMEPVFQKQEESMPSHAHDKTGEKTSQSDSTSAKPQMHDNHQGAAKKPVADKKLSDTIPLKKKPKQLKDMKY